MGFDSTERVKFRFRSLGLEGHVVEIAISSNGWSKSAQKQRLRIWNDLWDLRAGHLSQRAAVPRQDWRFLEILCGLWRRILCCSATGCNLSLLPLTYGPSKNWGTGTGSSTSRQEDLPASALTHFSPRRILCFTAQRELEGPGQQRPLDLQVQQKAESPGKCRPLHLTPRDAG